MSLSFETAGRQHRMRARPTIRQARLSPGPPFRARAVSSTVVALAALMLILSGCEASEPKLAPPERIFLFVVDTLRRDHVSAYGERASTPNMDALAARGQKINTALSAYHQTTMSMAALFTGRTPSLETGKRDTQLPWTGRAWCGLARFSSSEDKGCVPAGLTTLAERLKEAGYWTAGVTSNRLLFDPAGYSQGFDLWEELGVFIPSVSAKPVRNRAKDVHAGVFEALKARPDDRFFSTSTGWTCTTTSTTTRRASSSSMRPLADCSIDSKPRDCSKIRGSSSPRITANPLARRARSGSAVATWETPPSRPS